MTVLNVGSLQASRSFRSILERRKFDVSSSVVHHQCFIPKAENTPSKPGSSVTAGSSRNTERTSVYRGIRSLCIALHLALLLPQCCILLLSKGQFYQDVRIIRYAIVNES